MEAWWQAIVLGIVEGLTEFLPISSTGHLLIAARLLHFEGSLGGTFEIFIQLGAILAVLGYYARDLLSQARDLPRSPAVRRFWTGLLVAFLPAALVGLVLHDWIKRVLFATPAVIAASLIAGGAVLLLVDRLPRAGKQVSGLMEVSLPQALVIGLAQTVSLVPGVSRSGASMVGGLLAGLDRTTATRFAFYLAIPTLGSATLYDLAKSVRDLGLTPADLGPLAVGTAVSLAVAWASIEWLLRYVAQHSFAVFGVYRIIAGAVILALVAAGLL